MGKAPCCDKANVKKGHWSPQEDSKLKNYIDKYGTGGNWITLPQKAGLRRCGKSCRLRWLNYLRPNIKHGEFSEEEDRVICGLFASIGSRWSIIAAQLPGRTDNDIKNYWNTKLKKKLMVMANLSSSYRKQLPIYPQPITNPPTLPTSSSSLHKDLSFYYNTNTTKSLSGFESMDTLSNKNTPLFHNQNGSNSSMFTTSNMQYYNPISEENVFMFTTHDRGSCSSNSDGSCSYGRSDHQIQIKQEDRLDFDNPGRFISNGYCYNIEEQQKMMMMMNNNNNNYNEYQHHTNGFLGETLRTRDECEYNVEDYQVKELMNVINEENKKEEQKKMMYYYNNNN